jgi:prolipoprotein diacylglyceryltransferase
VFPVLQIGTLSLQTGGLILLVSVWLGWWLAERCASLFHLTSGQVSNLILVSLVSGVVGARLVYFITNIYAFANSPLNIFSLTPELFDAGGGLLFFIFGGLVFTLKTKIPYQNALDGLIPFMAIMLIGISLSNMAGGVKYGNETTLPWGIVWLGIKRHPVQVYEMLSTALVTLLILPKTILFQKNGIGDVSAIRFLTFISGSAVCRLFLEPFYGDRLLMVEGTLPMQIFWFAVIVTCIIFMDGIIWRHHGQSVDP